MTDISAVYGSSVEEVTTETNVTGQLDPVLRISPEEGRALRFRNNGPRGSRPGIPIYADLKDSSNNDLPVDTRVALAYQRQGEDNWKIISDPFNNISTYNNLSLSQQQDQDNVEAPKHEIKDRWWDVRDIDELLVVVDSSAQIDHSNSAFLFEPTYVDESDMPR